MALTKYPVSFFYDVFSPYSYIGFELITRYNKVWSKMDLQLKPCSSHHIFEAAQNSSPLKNPAKSPYLIRDLLRISNMADIPFIFPSNYAKLAYDRGSTAPLKFLIATSFYTESNLAVEALSRQLFRRIFTHDPAKEIQSAASWLEAGKAAKMDHTTLHQIIIQTETPRVRTRLRYNTFEALDYGAFGLPYMIIHSPEGPNMLFGSDRMELLAYLLGEKYFGLNPIPVNSNISL